MVDEKQALVMLTRTSSLPSHSAAPSGASPEAPPSGGENALAPSSPRNAPPHLGEGAPRVAFSPVQQHATTSPLQQAKQSLTGVVVWPRDIPNHASLPKVIAKKLEDQNAYGNHLHKGIVDISRQLRERKITSFNILWNLARSVRAEATRFQADGEGYGAYIKFMQPRHSSGILKTPISDQYGYMREVILRNFKGLKGDKEASSDQIWLSISGKTVDGQDEKLIPLTIAMLSPDRSNESDDVFIHTLRSEHESIKAHLETLFRRAIKELDAHDFDNFKKTAARIYWWSAHACFDVRGSAAKTEILFRALHEMKNIDCPLWKPGVSADLEVMIRTEEEWLNTFEDLQWSQQDFEKTVNQACLEDAEACKPGLSSSPVMSSVERRLRNRVL